MDKQFDDLVASALSGRSKAYAPYSKFAVGLALKYKSAAVFPGANIENRSLGLTICAERVAAAAAIAAGERDLSAIAVVADSDEPIAPCGACRQFLAEFAQISLSLAPASVVIGRSKISRPFCLSRAEEF